MHSFILFDMSNRLMINYAMDTPICNAPGDKCYDSGWLAR